MHGSQGHRERLRLTVPSVNIVISKVGYFELILGSLHAILVPRVLSFFFTHGQFVTTEAERV